VSLYDQAAADARAILEDSTGGFGVPMTLTAPDSSTQAITGMAADIGKEVDPETGVALLGRTAHVTLPTAALTIGTPVGVPDGLSDPWLVEFQLPGETAPRKFKINTTMPDRLGVLVCFLTEWVV
jgi:hypothetical protein